MLPSRRPPWGRRATALFFLLSLLPAFTPFALGETDRKGPILLIGLDGADWQVIDPLIEQGRLPNLARLKRTGAWASLRSEPPMLSPLLWTSIATGKPASEHGIIDFLVADPATGKKVPITSTNRKVRAIWNITSDAGLAAGVVAWWATWPAEEIKGTMVSDRLAYSLFDYRDRPEDRAGLVWPQDALSRLAALRVKEDAVSLDDVRALAPFTREEFDRARRPAAGEEPRSGGYADPLEHLVRILASTRTYHAIALDLARSGRQDLLAVYYQGIDEICHRYAHYIPPRLPWVDEGSFEKLKGVVHRFYEMQDAMIGELVAAAGKDARVLVVSDHGFLSRSDRPDHPPDIELKAGVWHREYGIFIMNGPGVRPGALEPIGLYDVMPTLLWLARLPIGEDMRGRPVLAAMDDAFQKNAPVTRVATYETSERGQKPQAAVDAVAGAYGEEMLARLRSLGYIGSGDTADAPQERSVTLNNLYMTATVHLEQGDPALAEKAARALLEALPDDADAHALLSDVLDTQRRQEESLSEARTALNLMKAPEERVVTHYASLARRLGRLDEAEQFFLRYAQQRPGRGEPWLGLGIVQSHAGNWSNARRSLLRALELSPKSRASVMALYNVYELSGAGEETAAEIQKVVAANPDSAAHHTLLGLVRVNQKRPAEAETSFRRALALEPDRDLALAGLADLLMNTGRLDEARRMLESAVARKSDQLEVRMALGRAYLRSGRVEEASREMIEAARLDPSSPSAQAQAGLLLNMLEKTARAVPYMERALALDPTIYDVKLFLAVAYHHLRRFEDCERALKAAIAQRPEDAEPRRLLAALYEETGRPEEARRETEALRKLSGGGSGRP